MPSTTKYGIFKSIPGNREIDPNHVQRIVDAIEKKNLLSEFPILVNDKMEVIDGQNRLLAAATLGVPIFYQTVKGLGLTHVMDINTASKSWTVLDFVKSYIELGNTDYAELLDFCTGHKIGFALGAGLLSGFNNLSSVGGPISKLVRGGKFQVNAPCTAEKVIVMMEDIVPYADFKVLADRELSRAIWYLNLDTDFDISRLVGKLKTFDMPLRKSRSTRAYILQIEELYNYKAKNRVTLYKGQA